jgi:ribose 5-phosphate isomerase B
MRVHLGSDHAGLELKNHLATWLDERGYDVVDHGPHRYDASDDYPAFCLRAAEGVAQDRNAGTSAGTSTGTSTSMGVVIGGSGNGEQMAANKVNGVRAALVWSEETAMLARQHNDANVISVGGRMHSLEEMTGFVDVFLRTSYGNEQRHTRRIDMLRIYETTGELPLLPHSTTGPPTGPSTGPSIGPSTGRDR